MENKGKEKLREKTQGWTISSAVVFAVLLIALVIGVWAWIESV